MVRLPPGPDGAKVGLDDYLLAHGPDALRALLAAGPAEKPPPRAPAPDPRPEIVVAPDEFRVNAEAAAALAAEPDVYQRGGLLVHVTEQDGEADPADAVRRSDETPAVRELARPLLRERLTRAARWHCWRGSGENAKLVPARPPDWAVGAVHARGRWPGVRRLDAILTHPILLPDGSALAANGYHTAAAALVCLPPGCRSAFKYPDLRARRGPLRSAALTVLRGWQAAGRPRHGLPAWGSNEGWSGVVREAVVFAGLSDPEDTRLALQTAADRDAAMSSVLDGLERMDPAGRG